MPPRALDFGAGAHVGAAVFVAKPGGARDEGWLISECVDGKSERTFFAVFGAAAPDDGPLAKIWLTIPSPSRSTAPGLPDRRS